MITLVTAVIRHHALEDVKQALEGVGVTGMTVTEVTGFGRQGGRTETYRGAEYTLEFLPKIKVEVLVPEDQVGVVEEAIVGAARSGRIGDGKVWTVPVGSVTRIRTGERDGEAC